jgi:hypothetical protein
MNILGHVACIRERVNVYRILVGKAGREPFGRLRQRYKISVKINL